MGLKRVVAFGLFTMILTGLIVAGIGYAAEQDPPFPSYGSGLVEVRLCTDHLPDLSGEISAEEKG